MHEIGRAVAHDEYHRRGAYILGHSDGAGFSLQQLERLGALVLGQRGGLRKVAPRLEADELRDPLVCLRLAVLLCHARQPPGLAGLRLMRKGRHYHFAAGSDWAAQHPRTMVLLEEETAHWKRAERGFDVLVVA